MAQSDSTMTTARQLKILILGLTGSGKSTLSNVLLGLKHDDKVLGFETSDKPECCTLEVTVKDGYWLGDKSKPIRIIDTPGYGDQEGVESKYREKFVETIRNEGAVDAFIWVKNSQNPRFDEQQAKHVALLAEMFGGAFFLNLVVVFSRWEFSEKVERRRRNRAIPITLDRIKKEFWNSLVKNQKNVNKMLMMAVDACYDITDEIEATAFRRETESLWETITNFSRQPVDNIKVAHEKMEKLMEQVESLTTQLQNMRRDTTEERKRLERLLMEKNQEIKKIQDKYNGPEWLKYIPIIGPVVSAVKKTLDLVGEFVVQPVIKAIIEGTNPLSRSYI